MPIKSLFIYRKSFILLILLVFLAVVSTTTACNFPISKKSENFNGEEAIQYLKHQVELGPRVPGSQAHQETVDWIAQEMTGLQWEVSQQTSQTANIGITNIIAKRGKGTPWIILGAHYDSRLLADKDPDATKRSQPVPGANDGASGVAVLMELGRVLPQNLNIQIWLVFFDAEDDGKIDGYDWILGSRAFVRELAGKPDSVVIVDMVGDADLNIYQERNSDARLVETIWAQAAELGYSQFIPKFKNTILDDHVPFLEAGIPAADIIDIDYSYWHTTSDTLDKVSSQSLQAVGDTLLAWLVRQPNQ